MSFKIKKRKELDQNTWNLIAELVRTRGPNFVSDAEGLGTNMKPILDFNDAIPRINDIMAVEFYETPDNNGLRFVVRPDIFVKMYKIPENSLTEIPEGLDRGVWNVIAAKAREKGFSFITSADDLGMGLKPILDLNAAIPEIYGAKALMFGSTPDGLHLTIRKDIYTLMIESSDSHS